MRLIDLFRRAVKNLFQSKSRTFLTSLAIAVGAFTITISLAAGEGTRQYTAKIIQSNFDPSELIVTKTESALNASGNTASEPQEYSEGAASFGGGGAFGSRTIPRLDEADIEALQSTADVESVRPSYTTNPQFVTRDGYKQYNASLQGYAPGQKPQVAAGTLPDGLGQINDDTVIMPESFLKSFGFDSAESAVGKQIRFQFQRTNTIDPNALRQSIASGDFGALESFNQTETREESFTIGAVSKTSSTSISQTPIFYVSQNKAKSLSDYTTENTDNFQKYLIAYVKVRNGTDASSLNKVKDALVAKGYGVQSVEDTQAVLNTFIDVLQYIVLGFGVLALIASVFGIINTQYISVLERTGQIGLQKALGMRARDVATLFSIEAAGIGFLGGIIGSGLAVLLGTIFNPAISELLSLDGSYLLIFQPASILFLLIGLIVIAIIAGLIPAIKAARLNPIEALRSE